MMISDISTRESSVHSRETGLGPWDFQNKHKHQICVLAINGGRVFLLICRCGPHLHWAPHIEGKRDPRKAARWRWRQVEQQPLTHSAHNTQHKYHMWVNSILALVTLARFLFPWSLVWWVTLSWPFTNTFHTPLRNRSGNRTLTEISTLSAKEVKFLILSTSTSTPRSPHLK